MPLSSRSHGARFATAIRDAASRLAAPRRAVRGDAGETPEPLASASRCRARNPRHLALMARGPHVLAVGAEAPQRQIGAMKQPDETRGAIARAGHDGCAADAALVRAFVCTHFSLHGAVRLHRASLGADLLRAPVNVLLAPVFLLVRLAAL